MLSPPHHQKASFRLSLLSLGPRCVVSRSHRADLFPSLLSLLAPLREAEKPAQGHALVSSGSYQNLVAGSSLLCGRGPSCKTSLPVSLAGSQALPPGHFTLRSFHVHILPWSLEFGMAVPVAQDSFFTLFSLSLCLQKTQCPQGTYSQSCSAERSSLQGLLPGLFLRPQGLVGELPTPPIPSTAHTVV